MENQVRIIIVADIVEENGKTIRQNNMELKHNIPVGALVEVKYDKWLGGGACKKVHARLWVESHGRDCDGTPLYNLSDYNPTGYFGTAKFHSEIVRAAVLGVIGGYGEESLTVVEVTDALERGEGALEWEKE